MIVKQFFMARDDGVKLFKTSSDAGLLIRKISTDEVYDIAIDIEDAPWEYEETDIPIESVENIDGDSR